MGTNAAWCFVWSSDRVDQLKGLWADGKSLGVIAEEMGGGLSRSAVMGKISRLGLSGRTQGTKATLPRRPKRLNDHRLDAPILQSIAAKREKPPRLNPHRDSLTDLPPDQSPDAVRFLDREGETCRYPLNSVFPIADHMVCGTRVAKKIVKGAEVPLSYCLRHYYIATDQRGTARAQRTADEREAESDLKQGRM